MARLVNIMEIINDTDKNIRSVIVPGTPCTCTSHRISVVLAPSLVILTNRPLNVALALQGRYLISSGAKVSPLDME